MKTYTLSFLNIKIIVQANDLQTVANDLAFLHNNFKTLIAKAKYEIKND